MDHCRRTFTKVNLYNYGSNALDFAINKRYILSADFFATRRRQTPSFVLYESGPSGTGRVAFADFACGVRASAFRHYRRFTHGRRGAGLAFGCQARERWIGWPDAATTGGVGLEALETLNRRRSLCVLSVLFSAVSLFYFSLDVVRYNHEKTSLPARPRSFEATWRQVGKPLLLRPAPTFHPSTYARN
jgi:hypothetical protein